MTKFRRKDLPPGSVYSNVVEASYAKKGLNCRKH